VGIYLGVDGGGTKTAFVLLTSDGEILATVEGPSSYHLEHGFAHVEQVFVDGVAAVTASAGIRLDEIGFAFFAVPGYGEASRLLARLDALPHAALGHDRYRCGNDMIAGWAGSLAASDGINVVAGTGSMTYGERAGRGTRVGGWGELFGDEGSGYWIALQALNAFSRMSDGRLPRTPLYERIRTATGVEADLDVVDLVFTRWDRSRGRIAALAPVVGTAAADGDPTADAILEQAAMHLADLVDATRKRLGFEPGERVPVSYSGGVFRADVIRSRFAENLRDRSRDHDLQVPRFPPHIGAALYAAKLAGDPLDPSALAHLELPTSRTGDPFSGRTRAVTREGTP
jgi:N-acetylglucosamine kinase-like BadF-type ATPase